MEFEGSISGHYRTALHRYSGRVANGSTENKKAAIRFSLTAASKGGRGKLDLRNLKHLKLSRRAAGQNLLPGGTQYTSASAMP
jgi:hypothetical protein